MPQLSTINVCQQAYHWMNHHTHTQTPADDTNKQPTMVLTTACLKIVATATDVAAARACQQLDLLLTAVVQTPAPPSRQSVVAALTPGALAAPSASFVHSAVVRASQGAQGCGLAVRLCSAELQKLQPHVSSRASLQHGQVRGGSAIIFQVLHYQQPTCVVWVQH